MDNQKTLVFLHIFKTAGLSTIARLREHFSEETAVRVHERQEAAAAIADPTIRAVASHMSFNDFRDALEDELSELRFFTFVRHPIKRLVSAYRYQRGMPGTKHRELASSNDINGFYDVMLKERPAFCNNHQCRRLAWDRNDFSAERVIENIERNIAFVGLQDDMAASSPASISGLGFDVTPSARKNTAPSDMAGCELSREMRHRLIEANQEDFALYEYVRAKLSHQATATNPSSYQILE